MTIIAPTVIRKEQFMSRTDSARIPKLSSYYEALGDRERRYALYYLSHHRSANIEEVARHVTAMKQGRSPDAISDEEVEPVQQRLQHNHLPRLADHGIIEFDPRSSDVQFYESSRPFQILLWFSELLERQP